MHISCWLSLWIYEEISSFDNIYYVDLYIYKALYNFLNIYRELTHRKKNGNKIVYEN